MNQGNNITHLMKLLRPKQWIKNFFVFAAVIFSGNFTKSSLLLLNVLVFILFCFSSSAVYIFNDIQDIEKDRIHPEKKFRPLASGKVSKREAIILNIILSIGTLVAAYFVNKLLLLVVAVYMVTNVLYSIWLKEIVIIDVMIITFGFVLRVESGSIITNVRISPWLFLCTILLSLFLALNKRKSEIISLKERSREHRKILEDYSISFLDKMLGIVTPSALMAYCLYTFSSTQSKTMMITIPFVLYGIFRYEFLIGKSTIGGKPEEALTHDLPFFINMILWVLTVLGIIYFKM